MRTACKTPFKVLLYLRLFHWGTIEIWSLPVDEVHCRGARGSAESRCIADSWENSTEQGAGLYVGGLEGGSCGHDLGGQVVGC